VLDIRVRCFTIKSTHLPISASHAPRKMTDGGGEECREDALNRFQGDVGAK
jgi:hypothetical protein